MSHKVVRVAYVGGLHQIRATYYQLRFAGAPFPSLKAFVGKPTSTGSAVKSLRSAVFQDESGKVWTTARSKSLELLESNLNPKVELTITIKE